ncbi:hypothetical protein [uncultured Alteromonas sp.]|uniref:hypothetical protein n=1 Tax=uncultured Alteromonas sp. TaxID=179113 RepID=UPI0030D44DAD|tara:strand:+ start:1340 stop:1975 length:636 start_codon:yes stop_codon:yes gene_type:complete
MFLKKELTEYNRYQAFAVHMAISLVIFFILLVCITQYWYPGILFDTGNGWKAIGMIVGIDLVLGPLLTFIVFNHNKNSLKFDLAIIALVQTAALVYGTWTIHQTRPVALAFINNSFHTIYASSNIVNSLQIKMNTLKTNQLFYLFDDSIEENTLNPSRFEAYATFAKQVVATESQYKVDNFIQLDPLSTSKRFIKVDSITGEILSVATNPK